MPTVRSPRFIARTGFNYDALLPESVYAAAGGSVRVWHDNVLEIADADTANYAFAWSALHATPTADADKAILAPASDGDVISLSASKGGAAWASSMVVRTPSTEIVPKNILCVGDSLTALGQWPGYLAAALPTCNIMYVGVGGYTYACYIGLPASPMYHGGVLNVPWYVSTLPHVPDVVLWLLGINDTYGAATTYDAAESAINTMLYYCDVLWAAWQAALPSVLQFHMTTPPPNISEAAFTADYGGTLTRTTCIKGHAHLVKRLRSKFWGQHKMVPCHLDFDPTAGYVGGNALHPGNPGYQSIADQVAAFLRWKFQS
jgi:hypothetical protein